MAKKSTKTYPSFSVVWKKRKQTFNVQNAEDILEIVNESVGNITI